ncbi:MAG TPA: carboxypeptidase-like regulatory domain-containing protein, partial [Acidimicrobiales bacterium]|nr:carboxypeptidase-like regulatory domain-containing protein [Acidimicrobiales bacterium]
MKSVFVAALACAALLAGGRDVSGQATTGELTGRVVDTSGDVVPGVTVTMRNEDTGLVRSVVTNESGDYLFVLMPPGRYTVEAELSGFKKIERRGVVVAIGSRQTLPLQLEVGALTEVLVVTGEVPLIETTRSDIGGVITPTEITGLPLLN